MSDLSSDLLTEKLTLLKVNRSNGVRWWNAKDCSLLRERGSPFPSLAFDNLLKEKGIPAEETLGSRVCFGRSPLFAVFPIENSREGVSLAISFAEETAILVDYPFQGKFTRWRSKELSG